MNTETELENSAENDNAKAFAQRVCDIINAGAVSVMISIGHRSGLFDVLAGLEPKTSQEIADTAKLAERYVREWLAVMVIAKIVHYDPNTKTYVLPTAHAMCLTRNGELGNFAVYAQLIPLMGGSQEKGLQFLENGSGASYTDYPCFHDVMAEDSEQSVVNSLFETILPLINNIDIQLQTGINVLDQGCGKGYVLIEMAQRYPKSNFFGYDLCEEAIYKARHIATGKDLENIHFSVNNMTDFDESEHYDLITSFDAVHDQKDPQQILIQLYKALKPSGVLLMQDIGGSAELENNMDFPMASLLYAISFSHCTPVSIGQGGEGLGTMWGWETALSMLRTAGFTDIKRHVLPHDIMNVWFIGRKAQFNG